MVQAESNVYGLELVKELWVQVHCSLVVNPPHRHIVSYLVSLGSKLHALATANCVKRQVNKNDSSTDYIIKSSYQVAKFLHQYRACLDLHMNCTRFCCLVAVLSVLADLQAWYRCHCFEEKVVSCGPKPQGEQ